MCRAAVAVQSSEVSLFHLLQRRLLLGREMLRELAMRLLQRIENTLASLSADCFQPLRRAIEDRISPSPVAQV